jgi:ankyrin repeat protein
VKGLGSANPLVVAASEGLTDCLKWLLDAGADPNVPDDVS